MPITLSQLTWSTPEGRTLFTDLDLSFGPLRTGLVGRNGTGKTTLLKLIAGEIPLQGGSISRRGTIAFLHQTLAAEPDATVADLFGARAALTLLTRAEAGVASVEELADADWTLPGRIAEALARIGLDTDADTPLERLSGGQRTRAGLAALVFREPDFLLLDEPTNNLDREGRDAVHALLRGWRKGAIVVSHDRALLDAMDVIVELTSLGAKTYGGNGSLYRERKVQELEAAEHDLTEADRRVAETARAAQSRLERQAARDRGGRKKAAKGDAPRILLGARKERAENTGGSAASLADRQRNQALEAAAAARTRIEVLQPMSAIVPACGLAAGKTVLRLDAVTGGYDPNHPIIRELSFSVTGPERVALTGPNGSGKTTLLSLITGTLAPRCGKIEIGVPFALLDQEVRLLEPDLSIVDNFRHLHPGASDNACRAALARFMFRAEAAEQTVATLSGGQRLRAGLATVLGGQPPQFLLLDEPTNHLDLAAIEAVEAGLKAYDGALLIVSHDETFLANVGIGRQIALGA